LSWQRRRENMENVDSPLTAVNYGRAFYVEIEAVKRASGGRWT